MTSLLVSHKTVMWEGGAADSRMMPRAHISIGLEGPMWIASGYDENSINRRLSPHSMPDKLSEARCRSGRERIIEYPPDSIFGAVHSAIVGMNRLHQQLIGGVLISF